MTTDASQEVSCKKIAMVSLRNKSTVGNASTLDDYYTTISMGEHNRASNKCYSVLSLRHNSKAGSLSYIFLT